MKNLIKLRCNLLILTLANVLIFAAACTKKGGDEPINPISPTTRDTIAPTAGEITEITTASDRVNVSWTPASDNLTPPDKLTYQVLCLETDGTTLVKSSDLLQAITHYTLTGLAPETVYMLKIAITDLAGNKAYYSLREFSTPRDPTAELDTTNYVQLTTQKKADETVNLTINATQADREGVWLDLNANGKWDEGVDMRPTTFKKEATYTLKTSIFRVYGKTTQFNAEDNKITALVSKQPYLKELSISRNPLGSLSFENQPVLEDLSLSNTQITALDTRQLPDLTTLTLSFADNIKTLDVTQNPKLAELYIDNLDITTLNLTKNPKLEILSAQGVGFTALEVSGNPQLKQVYLELRSTDSRGLTGTALMNFIKTLPSRVQNEEGKIILSAAQQTKDVLKALQIKNWTIIND